jgi:phosphoribosyl 1,2-cyclic phosphodiesterase
MSKICPLFSGSTGNSTYIGTKYGAILVDAGASMRGIKSGIEAISGDIDEVKAIVVTHQHNDHIKGLKTLLSKTKADLIASKETLESLCSLGVVPAGINIKCIDSKMPISVNDTNITRFATSHDCEGSSGYTFTLPDGKKVAICTDLGIINMLFYFTNGGVKHGCTKEKKI